MLKSPLFPPWADKLVRVVGILLLGGAVYFVVLTAFAVSPFTTRIGYQPKQPVPYSHELHAGKLGLDCLYCHTTVETSAKASIPPTETCMNCHATIKAEEESLVVVKESYESGMPIKWVRIHNLPDFVFFDHSAHVTRGIGCVSCHGRIDTMEEVYQDQLLTMGWCLSCHRNPDKYLRPLDEVTNMEWVPAVDPKELGRLLRTERDINPSTDCWTCHR